MKIQRLILGLLLSLSVTSAYSTVVLNIDGTGQLTGASGVVVGSNVYDVTFFDDSCFTVFNNCGSYPAFNFHSLSTAQAAAAALESSVFVNSPSLGMFDSDSTLTFGCESTLNCNTWIPYRISVVNVGWVNAAVFKNQSTSSSFSDSVSNGSRDSFISLTTSSTSNWARFTQTGSVTVPPASAPEPTAFALVGLGLVAFSVRRRKRK